MINDLRLHAVLKSQTYPLLFATISGAHLYGFPSPDSDYDLRGVHLLPVSDVLGLEVSDETIECSQDIDGLQIDLVTHDAKKFALMLLKKNGYVLEQLFSPLIMVASPLHDVLKTVARGCITRHHSHHYIGLAEKQWRLFNKETPRRVKPLLYVYRGLLTGIYLMQTGEIEANLPRLNEHFRLPYLPDLIARKVEGSEKGILTDADMAFHEAEFRRLRQTLDDAFAECTLPETPTNRDALNDFLVQVRLETIA